jgi:putative tricarboxylic transport membrane protein
MAAVRAGARIGSRDLIAGLVLVGIGVVGLLLSDGQVRALAGMETARLPQPLSPSRGAYLGSGSFPFGLFALLVVIGMVMMLLARSVSGERAAKWRLRQMVMILAAVFVFAATIRSLGLLIAGPAAITLASFAAADFRWRELMSSAILTTAASIVVFIWLLRLPVPIAPWLGW